MSEPIARAKAEANTRRTRTQARPSTKVRVKENMGKAPVDISKAKAPEEFQQCKMSGAQQIGINGRQSRDSNSHRMLRSNRQISSILQPRYFRHSLHGARTGRLQDLG